jgi:hypothetical protein
VLDVRSNKIMVETGLRLREILLSTHRILKENSKMKSKERFGGNRIWDCQADMGQAMSCPAQAGARQERSSTAVCTPRVIAGT